MTDNRVLQFSGRYISLHTNCAPLLSDSDLFRFIQGLSMKKTIQFRFQVYLWQNLLNISTSLIHLNFRINILFFIHTWTYFLDFSTMENIGKYWKYSVNEQQHPSVTSELWVCFIRYSTASSLYDNYSDQSCQYRATFDISLCLNGRSSLAIVIVWNVMLCQYRYSPDMFQNCWNTTYLLFL